MRWDVVEAEDATPLAIQPPDARGGQDEQNKGGRGERHDPLPTDAEPRECSETGA